MKVLHGAKIRIYPERDQIEKFDLWRRRCLQLWNLLLGMEQAAYSGDKFKPELGWRKIWAEVAKINYDIALSKGKDAKEPEYEKILPRKLSLGQPKLFIWQNDLMKIMARLKSQPHSKWIGDLHSHAAQQVCKDLIKALQAMIREAKKENGLNAGFPKFKKTQAYADGSVYFANTQIKFDADRKKISLPLGVGKMKCGEFNAIPKGAKLMGGRIFRVGNEWWLSAQFEFEVKSLPKTGKECSVKVAAKAVYTVFDGQEFDQYMSAQKSYSVLRREKLAARRLSRRKKRSGGFYEAAHRVAQYHANERNRQNDILHKGSRNIVNNYDKITLDKMDVAAMAQGDVKFLRKYIKNAAMAKAAQFIIYKAEEAGRTVDQRPIFEENSQSCSSCKTLNPQMKDGRMTLKCICCGHKMQRQKNASVNLKNCA